MLWRRSPWVSSARLWAASICCSSWRQLPLRSTPWKDVSRPASSVEYQPGILIRGGGGFDCIFISMSVGITSISSSDQIHAQTWKHSEVGLTWLDSKQKSFYSCPYLNRSWCFGVRWGSRVVHSREESRSKLALCLPCDVWNRGLLLMNAWSFICWHLVLDQRFQWKARLPAHFYTASLWHVMDGILMKPSVNYVNTGFTGACSRQQSALKISPMCQYVINTELDFPHGISTVSPRVSF